MLRFDSFQHLALDCSYPIDANKFDWVAEVTTEHELLCRTGHVHGSDARVYLDRDGAVIQHAEAASTLPKFQL